MSKFATMRRSISLSLLYLLLYSSVLWGQTEILPKKRCRAFRTSSPPAIDAVFDDPGWRAGEWSGGFVQHQPYENRPPSQPTAFKVAYDDTNLYIAIRAFDSSPDSIISRMSRRDDDDGDMVFVVLDSYHDLRTGFVFGVSSAGVRFDMTVNNNGQNEDDTWDPIWQAKTRITDWGWAAEMKIPFTQLRFQKNAKEVWGFELARLLYRKNELSFWHPIPRNAPGMIHAMGELDGLQELKPRKQFDLTPYLVTTAKSYEPQKGNPFLDGSDFGGNFGLDGKLGITNNLTLDFSINPDFGQVEADPSELNLTAFESYFREQRPFFIEGAAITSFNVGLGGGDMGNDNLFYSRRIGRKPRGYPRLSEGEYAEVPSFTRILGAAKLSGKTEKGLSIGMIDALTANTRATVAGNNGERKESVEPLTNYALLRLQKDLNKGNTIIGGVVTNTGRRLDELSADHLHKMATTAGIDFKQYFRDRNYLLSAVAYMSNVRGSTAAIAKTQRSSARYFHRSDAIHLNYDTTQTSLSGMGGKFQFGKIGGNWNFLFMSLAKSPGLELNDMGFMQQADKLVNVLWTGYNITEPFGIFNRLSLNNLVYLSSDMGGTLKGLGYEYNVNASMKNQWQTGLGGGFTFKQASSDMLRGGPLIYLPNSLYFGLHLYTDERKAVSGGIYNNLNWAAEDYYMSHYMGADLTIRPSNSLNISFEPEFSMRQSNLQYITEKSLNGEARYIFGSIDQHVLSLSLRLNYTITPDLTIQYWGQPFIASGDYSVFKMITKPKADRFEDRFHVFSEEQISRSEGGYEISENGDSVPDYRFENPDFSLSEWLSNLVVRWEFRPGSTAYLVWSQNRDHYAASGDFHLGDHMHDLYTSKQATNTILLKLSYRIGLH